MRRFLGSAGTVSRITVESLALNNNMLGTRKTPGILRLSRANSLNGRTGNFAHVTGKKSAGSGYFRWSIRETRESAEFRHPLARSVPIRCRRRDPHHRRAAALSNRSQWNRFQRGSAAARTARRASRLASCKSMCSKANASIGASSESKSENALMFGNNNSERTLMRSLAGSVIFHRTS